MVQAVAPGGRSGPSPLPPPFGWPTARRIRLDRIVAVALLAVALGPVLVIALWAVRAAPERREGPLALFLAVLLLPAIVAPVLWYAADRRGRGLVLTAIRGGSDGAIEVRPRSGFGRGLVIPIAQAFAFARIYRVGVARHIGAAEVVSRTAAGEVLFARGGTSLDPDLVRWIEDVWGSYGSTAPSPDAVDVEDVASRAVQDPLDAPPPIQARLVRGSPTYSYPATEPRGKGLAASLIAVNLTWLVLYPALNIFPFAKLAPWIIGIVLLLVWGILLHGPLTVELEVRGPMLIFRRRRFGLTLWTSINDGTQSGLEISQLPFVALRVKGRLRGFTTPAIGGPDAVAMAWLSAAIRAAARGAPLRS